MRSKIIAYTEVKHQSLTLKWSTNYIFVLHAYEQQASQFHGHRC